MKQQENPKKQIQILQVVIAFLEEYILGCIIKLQTQDIFLNGECGFE